LIYCANSPDRAYYLNELEALAAAHDQFRMTPHYFEDEGPLSRDWLVKRVPDFSEREIYICGPAPLIQAAQKFCRQAGVPASRFHSEAFTFL
jgi:ferredoxin-NADP reductase